MSARRSTSWPLVSLAVLILSPGLGPADARPGPGLTFEERLGAREAIERVYYSHQIGATRSFEEAVPRGVIERKVRSVLGGDLIPGLPTRTCRRRLFPSRIPPCNLRPVDARIPQTGQQLIECHLTGPEGADRS